jgi:Ras family
VQSHVIPLVSKVLRFRFRLLLCCCQSSLSSLFFLKKYSYTRLRALRVGWPFQSGMMSEYQRLDSYQRAMYEQGIDAKIVIMGNTGQYHKLSLSADVIKSLLAGVGKTSLLQRYTQDKFDPKNTTSTTGAFFVTKKVYKDGLKVRLQLWDTAGQERFRSMVSHSPTPLRPTWPDQEAPSAGSHVLSRRKRCSPVI